MHLREGEIVLKKFRRHLMPYLFRLMGVFLLAIPPYLFVFYFVPQIDKNWLAPAGGIVSFFTGIIITVISIDYLLDSLSVTNKRVIWVDWRSIFNREEHEVELHEIQDIKTEELGVLSAMKIFDFGLLLIESAASKTSIVFRDCADPEGVKHFILSHIADGFPRKNI